MGCSNVQIQTAQQVKFTDQKVSRALKLKCNGSSLEPVTVISCPIKVLKYLASLDGWHA